MRSLAFLAACSLIAASAPASADVGECRAASLSFDDPAAGWQPVALSRLKRDTGYTVSRVDGRAVLRAEANRSASLYVARWPTAQRTPMRIRWDWMTEALVPGADSRDKSKEDAPLRLIVAFDGDFATLPEAERKRMTRARNLSGRAIPYAVLMYIWTDQVPVGTVIPSAHTSQLKMIAVASGIDGLGRWQSVQRDLAKDYQQAFGKAAGPVLGVAVMTDTDNTGGQAVGNYADIRIECPGR